MTDPDYAKVMGNAIMDNSGFGLPLALANALAAQVPELCTTWPSTNDARHIGCDDCPTIGSLLTEAAEARQLAQQHDVKPAKLLAIGAAVMGATIDTANEAYVHTGGSCSSFADELLAALRAVQP